MWIQSTNVWYEEELQPLSLQITDKRIQNITQYGINTEAIDYGENLIIPGLIDIHDHGYKDISASHSNPDELLQWAKYLLSEGVTSFLPTIPTINQEAFLKALENISSAIDQEHDGAELLGIHTEGVIISKEKKGAHDESLLRKPSVELFEIWQKSANNKIVLVALASECDENHNLIRHLKENGIVVSLAHTNASYEQAKHAIADGASSFTHTFNAMSGVHHRKPGVAVAALTIPNTYAELICDGVHVDFSVGRLVGLAKGSHYLISITDAMPIKGLPPGTYKKKGTSHNIIIDEFGVSRLEDGTLSGSSARMIDMVRNVHYSMNLPLVTAINSATINPAKLLGIDHKKGLLKEGYDADIVVIDHEFNVLATYARGRRMFKL